MTAKELTLREREYVPTSTPYEIPIFTLNDALNELCSGPLKGAVDYVGVDTQGYVMLSIPIIGVALRELIRNLDGVRAASITAEIEKDHLYLVVSHSARLPERRKLYPFVRLINSGGFNMTIEGEAIILKTKIRRCEHIALYTGDRRKLSREILQVIYNVW